MYVYLKSQLESLYTVGHYDPGTNKFIPESDHPTSAAASARARYMNGGDWNRQSGHGNMAENMLYSITEEGSKYDWIRLGMAAIYALLAIAEAVYSVSDRIYNRPE